MIRLRRGLCAALAAALPLACASAPATDERTVLMGSEASVVVLLPLNVTTQLPDEFGKVTPVVWAALESYLRRQGVHLKTVAMPAARRLWIESIREVRRGASDVESGTGFARAARVFVRKLSQHAEFDTVLAPSLFVQRAPIEGRTASWDGVQREVEIETTREQEGLPEDIELEGAAAAASLHAVVLDRDGEVLHEGQGGLDLLVRVRFRQSAALGTPSFEFTARPDPLGNAENLQEGIAEALSPFFPDLVPEEADTPRP